MIFSVFTNDRKSVKREINKDRTKPPRGGELCPGGATTQTRFRDIRTIEESSRSFRTDSLFCTRVTLRESIKREDKLRFSLSLSFSKNLSDAPVNVCEQSDGVCETARWRKRCVTYYSVPFRSLLRVLPALLLHITQWACGGLDLSRMVRSFYGRTKKI